MNASPAPPGDPAADLLDVFDVAVPRVYGYLLSRCGNKAEAEDLTSQTFLAAVDAVRQGDNPPTVSTAWLVGVARHKLVDHWRRRGREQRSLAAVGGDPAQTNSAEFDPWDQHIDSVVAQETLAKLGAHHRAALTLRYCDDLPVPQVAELLGRTVHATEALLVRSRAAFRKAYEQGGGRDA